jgi:hypothetical protein
MLGPRHDRAFNNNARRFYPHVGGHPQVYKVDQELADYKSVIFPIDSASPTEFMIDLGSNFQSHDFWEFYERSAIEVRYMSVAHPRANG